ncbi:hypothetical protein ACFOSC_12705 [Streptantibioticus rubrisoli]|uniref:CDP-Glycerol:Poly(Glycerophosphate) glycerophosphotransferase n=1 Tax=Streptantibioticus rubrisoli TaxID=1387313 RepID=A0ABT1P807_9ACTN|nr:hypothetical protein [Streptantibioticus rubrisoli]MCQ4041511.1 hypothetical protein [Streptantibioticus rubrisoli]
MKEIGLTEVGAGWIRVPVGPDSARWATRGRCHKVLLVIHNVTSATRLLDVLPLFRDDLRVQLLATCTGSSPFQAGVAELLSTLGIPVLPWEQALATPVDLAVSASFGGELRSLQGKLAVLSHGVGYNKKLATPNAERRTPNAERRTPNAELPAPVFGLSPEWLLADGVPVADALVLSHHEQADRLRAACPEAAPTAVLAGDPCFDRMLAARPYRERFRRALGVRRGQRLVLLNSTWNPDSLFGDGGDDDLLPFLLPRLTAELPADEYRIAAVLHPNIWYGHGPGQLRSWLDRARRSGLTLVDPVEGWRQALIAADAVLGDFGSVSYYAAALGTPVLLGAASLASLGADTPVADFVRKAPRLCPYSPLGPQLAGLMAEHHPLPGPGELTTSVPGAAAALLRRTFYQLMSVPEPATPALLDPLPLPPYEPPSRTAPLRVLTRLLGTAEVAVTRFADPRYEPDGEGEAHTAVHEDTLDPGLLSCADVIFRYGAADDPRLGPPEHWAMDVLERHRFCAVAAYVTDAGSCTVRTRAGETFRLVADPRSADPAAYASALHAWLAAGKEPADLAGGLTVWTGGTAHQVSVMATGSAR